METLWSLGFHANLILASSCDKGLETVERAEDCGINDNVSKIFRLFLFT